MNANDIGIVVVSLITSYWTLGKMYFFREISLDSLDKKPWARVPTLKKRLIVNALWIGIDALYTYISTPGYNKKGKKIFGALVSLLGNILNLSALTSLVVGMFYFVEMVVPQGFFSTLIVFGLYKLLENVLYMISMAVVNIAVMLVVMIVSLPFAFFEESKVPTLGSQLSK